MHESTNRCNGHIQVSPIGKTPKRDRKGCKKGKIEMIMKNNMGAATKAPKLPPQQHQLAAADSVFKKKMTTSKLFGSTTTNHQPHPIHVINSGSVIKNEIIDDPYTFTDSEPQSVGLYSATNCLSSTRKVQSVPSPVGSVSSTTSSGSTQVARKVLSAPTPTVLATASSGTTLTSGRSADRIDASATTAGGKTMRSVATSIDTMATTTAVAKTMNQLHADIARNRVAIVKRRKVVHPPQTHSNPPPPYLQHLLSIPNHHHQHHHQQQQQQQPSSHNVVVEQSSSSSSPSLSNQLAASPSASRSTLLHPPPQRTFARVSLPAKRLARQTTWQRERRTRHELLQRIQEAQQQLHVEKRDLFPLGLELSDSEDDDDATGMETSEVYQRHWFMGWSGGATATATGDTRGRESRLAQVRSELRRRLRQVWRGLAGGGGNKGEAEPPPGLVQAVVAAARSQPTATALILDPKLLASYSKQSRAKVSMLSVKQCSLCQRRALPCTRHCSDHIMYNVDQLLFAYCTAKLSDNTQCRVPVFDVLHQLPLCPQHARSHVNLTKVQPDTTPKRSRKKTKPSTLNRSRSKKKKKSRPSASTSATSSANFGGAVAGVSISTATTRDKTPSTTTILTTTVAPISNVETTSTNISSGEMADVFQAQVHSDVPQVEIEVQLDGVEVPEEVLAIASMDPAELASQASKLLEDHDFTNMLLPPDAFNDLFTEDKNGQYEPTKEETEELERALEAVDKDVRSLERTLTRSLPLAALPLPLPLPLDTATMTLLDDTSALTPPPPPPPPPPYTTYSNGFTSVQTDLRNS